MSENADFLVPRDHNFYDVIEHHIHHQQEQGRKVALVMDFTSMSSYALYRQHLRTGLNTSNWAVIATPAAILETTRARLKAGKGADFDFATHMGELPDLVEQADVFFDPHAFRSVVGAPFKAHERLLKIARDSGFHSEAAMRLENDRAYGKRIAQEAGIQVAPYVLVRTVADISLIDTLACDRVYLKYNDEQSIGAYGIEGARDALPGLLKEGKVIVEKFIGKTNQEINFCFVVSGLNVQPMCRLQESNRLLDNDTGGKIGTACSYHSAVDYDGEGVVDDPQFSAVYTALHEIADDLVGYGGFHGWVDLSFMQAEDGQWYFTEWMVRCAISNFATELHQMKMPFFDLLEKVSDGRILHIDDVWRTKHSYGLEVYSLPVFGNLRDVPSIVPIDPVLLSIDSPVVFDPLEMAGNLFDGESIFFDTDTARLGVLSCISDEPLDGRYFPDSVIEQMMPHLQTLRAQIPNIAWRSFTV